MKKKVKKPTFGNKILDFYDKLTFPTNLLSGGVSAINPCSIPEVRNILQEFCEKFFSDTKKRVFVFGINPGRFGSGITGVPFTDPVALEEYCGISNVLEKKRELSSRFVYDFIEEWGGAKDFYQNFFLTAVSPLGFSHKGLNYNYYDDPKFFFKIKPFIIDSMKAQIGCGASREAVILFGTGKNQKIFNDINNEYGFFEKVYALEHPRFIMQYKRKDLKKYLKKYQRVFSQARSLTIQKGE